MARTLRDLRTAIQPRIDAGDTDPQIQTWLRAGIANADVENAAYDVWLSSYDGLGRMESRRVTLETLVQARTLPQANQAEWNAISQAVNYAQKDVPVTLSQQPVRDMMRELQDVESPPGTVQEPRSFRVVEMDALFALSDNQVPRWQVLDVWDARIGEIEQARALP